MTDRERLDELEREAEEDRIADEKNRQVREAQRKEIAEEKAGMERQKTAELRAFCEVFENRTVKATKHTLQVKTLTNEGVDTVLVYFEHNAGSYFGKNPVARCRYIDDGYELIIGYGTPEQHNGIYHHFTDHLMQRVAALGNPEIGAIIKESERLARR